MNYSFIVKKLHKIALNMIKAKEEKEIFELTVRAAEKLLDFDKCVLDIVENDKFVMKEKSDSIKDGDIDYISNINKGIAGKVYKKGESEITYNIMKEEKAEPVNNNYKSGITIPIDEFGIFQAMSFKKNNFDKRDLELAEILISYTIVTLRKVKSEKKITKISYQDYLTNLYNRRFFEKKLKKLNSKEYLPLSIVVGDLDNFKNFNDKFGHLEGDKLLKSVANVFKKSCRKNDIVARIGGDEFGFILPKTSSKVVKDIIIRIKNSLNKKVDYKIRISLGFATKKASEENVQEIFKRADFNMYDNKNLN